MRDEKISCRSANGLPLRVRSSSLLCLLPPQIVVLLDEISQCVSRFHLVTYMSTAPKSGDYWIHENRGLVKIVRKWNDKESICDVIDIRHSRHILNHGFMVPMAQSATTDEDILCETCLETIAAHTTFHEVDLTQPPLPVEIRNFCPKCLELLLVSYRDVLIKTPGVLGDSGNDNVDGQPVI